MPHYLPAMIRVIRQYLPPCATGVALFAAFPAIHWFPLVWVALIPLLLRCRNATARQTAVQFWLAGWVFHSLLLQWLIANIFWAGGGAIIGYQLLCALLAFFWAGLGVLWAASRRFIPAGLREITFALLWAGMEWCQSRLFTGFGWSALGYSQGPDFAFMQCAVLGGVSFLSFVIVLFSGLLATAVGERKCRWIRACAALLLLAAVHGIGSTLIGKADYQSLPFRVGLIQSDNPQEMKWDWEYSEDMVQRAAEYSRTLTAAGPVDCLMWPEALVMRHFETEEMLRPMSDLTRDTGAYLFTGAVRADSATRKEYNSSVLIAPDGTIAGYYDKVHLAPFGEYMPFASLLPFLRQFVPLDVDKGNEQKVFTLGQRHLGPLICFEVLFTPMAEELRKRGADFLAVVTNLAWFGSSNAIPQELEIARFRAVETRLPLVHCANTGISGVFDPWGRFEPITGIRGRSGQLFHWNDLQENPAMGIMQRLLGSLPVAAPAAAPVPGGPVWFAALAGLLGLGMVGANAVRAGMARRRQPAAQ